MVFVGENIGVILREDISDMNSQESICIITARGGSKRIPRKNIKDFCGKPIIAYSICAALDSGIFDEVMVSTDDQEIADVARRYGAKVPFLRSEKNSDDYATTADVLTEVLEEYVKQGRSFYAMCCIYPTAPFITAEKLRSAYKVFLDSSAEMLEPVVAYSYPPQRSFLLRDGSLVYQWPEYVRTRSQDLETWYHDAGQFYFYNVSRFNKYIEDDCSQGGYMLRTVPFVLDEIEVQDIDNLSDWELAEAKFKLLRKRD